MLETDASYANLDEDAYDVIAAFTKSEERRDGKIEGKLEEKRESLRAIMDNLGFSLEKAMDVLNIPIEDRAQYIANI